MHDGKFYKQLDGISNPWAHLWDQLLLTFFFGSLEKKIFDDETIDLPKLYLRNIDDVYAVFENEST